MISEKRIIEALKDSKGGVYVAAQNLGCSARAIFLRIKNSEKLQCLLEELRGAMVDKAESKLDKAIEAGDPWAIQFALKTQGKSRGYVERTEVQVGRYDSEIERELARVRGGGLAPLAAGSAERIPAPVEGDTDSGTIGPSAITGAASDTTEPGGLDRSGEAEPA